jgi:hypothetical protein
MITENAAAVLLQESDTEDAEQAAYFAELGVPELTPAERAEWDAYLDVILERLAQVEAEVAENREVARRRIEMIQGWEHSVNETLTKRATWLRQRVEMFAAGYDYGSKKSSELPHGTFGFRAKADTLEITDQTQAVAFAEAAGLEIKKSVNKTPLLKYFKATGEVPSGCEYVEGGDQFFVKPAGV